MCVRVCLAYEHSACRGVGSAGAGVPHVGAGKGAKSSVRATMLLSLSPSAAPLYRFCPPDVKGSVGWEAEVAIKSHTWLDMGAYTALPGLGRQRQGNLRLKQFVLRRQKPCLGNGKQIPRLKADLGCLWPRNLMDHSEHQVLI